MALAAVAAFAGAAVQSATGFGFALVLSPALFAVMDPVEAVTALLVLGLALNLLVLFEGGRPEHVDWRALAPMLVAALPGLAIGAVALTELSKEVLQVAVGLAVIAAAGWQLRERARGHRPLPPAAAWGAGFASGVLDDLDKRERPSAGALAGGAGGAAGGVPGLACRELPGIEPRRRRHPARGGGDGAFDAARSPCSSPWSLPATRSAPSLPPPRPRAVLQDRAAARGARGRERRRRAA